MWTRFWRAAASRICDLSAAAADATDHPALEPHSLLLHPVLHKQKSPILNSWARLINPNQHLDQEDGVWRNFDGHRLIDHLSIKNISMSSFFQTGNVFNNCIQFLTIEPKNTRQQCYLCICLLVMFYCITCWPWFVWNVKLALKAWNYK